MHKLLIANRGEIACRIIRSCQQLGLKTVAVYSEADQDALHVELADEAVAIGLSPVRKSYLNIDNILNAAEHVGASVIHPGYGFLAENAEFARAVLGRGMVWVGPSPESILTMGDKQRARQIAESAHVPVVPGSRRFLPGQLDGMHEAAASLGFPLLVKATAGGGGIGMRRVEDASQLAAVVETTQSMAGKVFGDASVYFERAVQAARHIEVQVFGYGDGQGVHLFDRDCSVQRRFQKIVEEAPAPALPAHVRSELYRSALALVEQQQYAGAGTVEFIYDIEREQAYFLEMNTRIQVEHPITEEITGVDLVSWQIKQALGELDHVSQDAIIVSGHAIECRIYAEKPEKGFLPAPGIIDKLIWPEPVNWLRVDTGIRTGDAVTPYYDPMIAKVVVHGQNREEALQRMQSVLSQVLISGVSTNLSFLNDTLFDSDFVQAGVTTNFVNEFIARHPSEYKKVG